MKGGIKLLKTVANEGLPAAHHYLGRAYFKGLGVEADKDMALVHFQAAADKGKSLSQLLVADFHAYGVAGPVKIDLAIRYARLAAIQQQDKALKKIQEYELLRKAPDQVENSIPNPPIETPSSRNIAPVPAPELPPPPPAPVTQRLPSVYQPKTLAESGVSDPNVSTVVEVRAEDNSIKSFTSKAPAADTRILAKNAYWGKGQDVDLQRAFTLFTQSANAGDGESARYLGMMFMQGKGVKKDFKQALYWFDLAAQRGDAMAKSNLEKLQAILEK
jgi:TPR repeat protein